MMEAYYESANIILFMEAAAEAHLERERVSRNPNIIRGRSGKSVNRSRVVCLPFRRNEIKIPNSVYPGL